jgi:hypothetical protein
MSTFALPIPPGPLTGIPSLAYGTLRYPYTPKCISLSFGAWLQPRYIFGAKTLI